MCRQTHLFLFPLCRPARSWLGEEAKWLWKQKAAGNSHPVWERHSGLLPFCPRNRRTFPHLSNSAIYCTANHMPKPINPLFVIWYAHLSSQYTLIISSLGLFWVEMNKLYIFVTYKKAILQMIWLCNFIHHLAYHIHKLKQNIFSFSTLFPSYSSLYF